MSSTVWPKGKASGCAIRKCAYADHTFPGVPTAWESHPLAACTCSLGAPQVIPAENLVAAFQQGGAQLIATAGSADDARVMLEGAMGGGAGNGCGASACGAAVEPTRGTHAGARLRGR